MCKFRDARAVFLTDTSSEFNEEKEYDKYFEYKGYLGLKKPAAPFDWGTKKKDRELEDLKPSQYLTN